MIDNLEVLLNDFARRSFRDEADRDYIAARMAYRADLLSQALWASLQAFEKYLKYILLVNRVPAPRKRLGHDIERARNLIATKAPFKVELPDKACEHYFKLVNSMGAYRYSEMSQFSKRDHLQLLDRCVWSIRRYCTVLNHTSYGKDFLPMELEAIKRAEVAPHQKFSLGGGGELELILRGKNEFLKDALLWQNDEYCDPEKLPEARAWRSSFRNSPLYMHPEIIDEVIKYVWLPDDLIEEYRQHAKNIAERKTERP